MTPPNTVEAEVPYKIFENKTAAKRVAFKVVGALLGAGLLLNANPTLVSTFINAANQTCGNVEWGERRALCAEKVLNGMSNNVYPIGFNPGDEISMMVGNQGITFKTTRHVDFRGRKDSSIRFETLK